MKLAFIITLASFCTPWHTQDNGQVPFKGIHELESLEHPDHVRGTNNATYGPVPKSDQLINIEFLEIAPSPLLV
jgi:hypothetical protein